MIDPREAERRAQCTLEAKEKQLEEAGQNLQDYKSKLADRDAAYARLLKEKKALQSLLPTSARRSGEAQGSSGGTRQGQPVLLFGNNRPSTSRRTPWWVESAADKGASNP